MKQLIITALIATIAVIPSFANEAQISNSNSASVLAEVDNDRLFKARANYLRALNSDNDGLVESAIYNSLMLTIQHPEFDITPIVKKLQDLALSGESHVIRYKAYLSLSYLKDQDKFVGADELARLLKYENPNKFFGFLDKQIKNSLLTLKR